MTRAACQSEKAKAARTAALERSTAARARETRGYIERIRGLLLESGSRGAADTLARVKALMAEPRRAKSTRG